MTSEASYLSVGAVSGFFFVLYFMVYQEIPLFRGLCYQSDNGAHTESSGQLFETLFVFKAKLISNEPN